MPAEVAVERAATLPPLLERAVDRLNPVLVKEVRSALRGRAFAVGFTFVLILAMIVSTFALVVQIVDGTDQPEGGVYLAIVGVVFGLGAYGLVPFTAMASMAAEHDEGALELLQLSGISPGRMVLGKLGAAAVQAGLIYAAFLPFLSFAFLLRGVDLLVLATGLAGSFAGSVACSSLGILLGAALKARWLRVLGYVFLALVLIGGLQGMTALTIALGLGAHVGSGSTGVLEPTLLGLAGAALFAWLCGALATSRLTHAEENRSTAFRALGTAALALLSTMGVTRGDAVQAFGWILFGLVVAFPSMMFAVTEESRLPRAVLARARKRGAPWFLAPWMPGGGRGVLLVLGNCALALGAALLSALLAPGPRTDFVDAIEALLAFQVWLLVVLFLPSGLLARWLDRAWIRVVARVAVVVLPPALILVPTFLAFLAGASGDAFAHAGNPVHFVREMLGGRRWSGTAGFGLLAIAAALALVLNVPRVLASFGEVRRARRAAADAGGGADAASHA